MTRRELIARRSITPAPRQAASGPFRTFGEQLAAIARAAEQPGRPDPRLLQVQERAPAGSSEDVPAGGGFLVQPEFSSVLLEKAYATGQLLSRVSRLETSKPWSTGIELAGMDEQSRAAGSRWGGVEGFWENEATTATPTKPKFQLNELTLKKLLCFIYTSDELLSDTMLLEQAVTTALTRELVFKTENAIVNGTGSGQPLGILNSASCIVVPKESLQTAGTVTTANVTKIHARLWAASRPKAAWLVNAELQPQLTTLIQPVGTASGVYTMLFHFAEQAGEPDLLMGLPVIVSEYCGLPGALGDIVLADLGEYSLLQKVGGVDLALSLHLEFLTDQACYRARWRVDGSPQWHVPLIPLNGTNTVSPFVALAARS